MFHTQELAWAAGLFEGEGSIFNGGGTSTSVALAMTDLDVVEKFQKAVQLPVPIYKRTRRDAYKDVFEWRTARFEYAQALIAMLWPWLGTRRKQQAKICLALSSGGRKSPGTGPDLKKVVCPSGHLYNEKNTYIDKNNVKVCRVCRNKSSTRWYFANKDRSRVNKMKSYYRLKDKRRKSLVIEDSSVSNQPQEPVVSRGADDQSITMDLNPLRNLEV